MVLAEPAPKSSASLDAEGGFYFFMFLMALVAVIGIVFDPRQFMGLVGQTLGSVFSPFIALANGIVTFGQTLVSSIWSSFTKDVSSAGSSLYNNTIGRL